MTIYFVIAALVLLVVVGLAINALSKSTTIKGITGERLTREALEAGLEPPSYRVLHDVTLPSRHGTLQIDHIVVSRFGVFVLETQHLFGWIFAQPGSNTWSQSIGKNKKFTFQNPLRQNQAHVAALEAVTGLGGHAFVPLVVMTGRAEFRTAMPQGVVEIADLLDEVLGDTRVRLSARQVDEAEAAIIAAQLEPGDELNTSPVAGLQDRVGELAGDLGWTPKHRKQTLTGLRVVAMLLLGFVAWGSFNAFNTVNQERLETIAEAVEPASTEPVAQSLERSPGAQGLRKDAVNKPVAKSRVTVNEPAPRTQVTVAEPSPVAQLAQTLPQPPSSAGPGGLASAPESDDAPSLAPESLPLQLWQPPGPPPSAEIFIEPDPPTSIPPKLGKLPPQPPEERLVPTSEQLRQFEETLNCEVTGAFNDCSCYMASGDKVLVGYQRCRTLARYNGVEWITRPE